MVEPVVGPSPSEYVEEKTEPFSQSEIEARRLQKSVRLEEINAGLNTSVPLDTLVVPPDRDIRILVRPLTRSRSVSPGSQDNCEWLALHAEVAEKDEPQHKVLAVTQTSRDIKFSVRVPTDRSGEGASTPRPPLWCELYYDPASDNQILVNRSDIPLNLSRVSQQPTSPGPGLEYVVNPGSPRALSPGTWRINVNDVDVLDFRILEKRQVAYRVPSTSSSEGSTLSDMVNSSGKRSFVGDEEEGRDRKLRITDAAGGKDDGVIMFLRPKTDPLVFPLPTASASNSNRKEVAPFAGHPLLEMQKDETVEIPDGCEMESYTITKGEPIASTSLSSVFKANHSSVPEETIVVKVLKTRPPASSNVVTKPQEAERNVIRQADIWLREFQQHSKLEHGQIARLYGGDARYLSLYMEHVPSRDLTSWVDPATDHFRGDRNDAIRILHDMAGALHYIHGRNLVHNDIKPANILYSRERGAVLCDMGMSTHASNPATSGGTPYYVPPEFIGLKLRGAAGDVYALGVTMLFVLRKISFPDARGRRDHPRRLYWVIAELNRPPRYHRDGVSSAVTQMQQWLSEVNEARFKLNRKDKLDRIVFDMLAPQPSQRVTMRQVMREFTAKQAEN